MVKMAIKDNPHFELSDIEMRTSGRAYSVDTIKRLKRRFVMDELFFIIGIDAFLDLPKWKEPLRLINMTNIVIMSRPPFRFTDLISSPYLKDVSQRRLRELDKGLRTMASFSLSDKHDVFLCRVTEMHISASHIRALINHGKSIRYLLPEVVESYIISHGLYKGLEINKGRGR